MLSEVSRHHMGRTPLNAAVATGNIKTVMLLLEQPDIDIRLKELIQYAGAKDASICIYFDVIRFTEVDPKTVEERERKVNFHSHNLSL